MAHLGAILQLAALKLILCEIQLCPSAQRSTHASLPLPGVQVDNVAYWGNNLQQAVQGADPQGLLQCTLRLFFTCLCPCRAAGGQRGALGRHPAAGGA